jgi:DnaK suppressor protein
MEDLEQLAALRARLVARRDELIAQGDERLEPNRRDPSEMADEDEQPLNEMNQVIASRRNKQRALELGRVIAAIRKIDADPDEFGECLECGEEIPIRRLELMPWATHCVKCKGARDDTGRGYRRSHIGDYID